MVAAHRHVEALGIGINAALDFANAAPVQAGGIAVLFIASHHAAFATNAEAHVEVETILFALSRRAVGNQLCRFLD